MIIYKQFTFDAAHFSPNVPEGHKCKKLHGHTYQVTIFLEAAVLESDGWVMDFTELKAIVKPLVAQLDHSLLNDIEGLENPTTENLAIWLWQKIYPQLQILKRIELKETPTSGVIYEGK
ncbi:6-carboxytetrahydropterin synthase QueD [Mucilaginibacter ginsenosidivorax]|uniref:6-carboxy-5,6,7,8-tetrahydropterin synthase n=2 Tax=Mucilaginibacter ginsenosidivorax TaxID=862126 RepID=A0A5B8VUU2_9SPHI|nr:6-carboxytetrahydropterin synthase QueD [Mucilaginibacter ginsenosidivorax]